MSSWSRSYVWRKYVSLLAATRCPVSMARAPFPAAFRGGREASAGLDQSFGWHGKVRTRRCQLRVGAGVVLKRGALNINEIRMVAPTGFEPVFGRCRAFASVITQLERV